MLQFLIDRLTPVFTGMGVSPEDVQTYVTQLGGYIYTILGTVIALIVVLVAAHFFAKKGSRLVVRWTAVTAWLAIILVIVNAICLGPMYNNLAPIINGAASVSDEAKKASEDINVEIGEEGIVLAKNNDGTLPLAPNSNLNVFGWAATNPIYGGTGSGSADNTGNIDILQSLEDAGFNVNQSLIDMYVDYSATRELGGNVVSVNYTDWSLPEPPVEKYTDDLMNEAKSFSDTALVVISRSGGEGQDEPQDMKAVIDGTYNTAERDADGHENYTYLASSYKNNSTSYDDFDEGEHYLELSNTEEDMIELVTSEFRNVIVVINANNTMELGWVNDYESIKSVLLVPGTGATGMEALGEILNGTVNPSGRTADTFVYDLFDTPTVNNYGSFVYNNVQDMKDEFTEADEAFKGAFGFVNYVEGIYVGYKFYETAAEEGLINYDEKVLYPFGYGLSYTNFTQEITGFTENNDSVSVEVTVTNTGDVAGKDVVELYYNPPYYNGGIEKASVNLIDFDKTAVLAPGESQVVSFDVAYEDMASYDSKNTKVSSGNGGYILEAGDYTLSIRSDSHNVIDERTFTVDSDIDYSVDGRSSDGQAANNQFQDYSLGKITYLSRADGFANYEEAIAAPAEELFAMDDEVKDFIRLHSVAEYDPTVFDNPDDEMPVTGAKNGMNLKDFVGVSYDDESWNLLLDQMTFEDMANMVNLGGFQTAAVDSVGKVLTLDSDGTSGLNDWYIGVYGTAYATEYLIAQTWNKELAYRIGQAEGEEYASAGIYGTYSPAMNTHRSAFGGRNFEYYSEDGVLAGNIAKNTVNGLATKGVYAYIKHFVLNDQEVNRCSFLQTFADEQAIREIYMKPFEICVKSNVEAGGAEAGYPLAVMSSFNFIGDIWSGANPYLLNNVLRGEWGFRGMVLTDWNGDYGYQNTDDAVRNGNDAMLGFYKYDSNQLTDTDSATLTIALRQACKNIMYTTVNSGNYFSENLDTGMDALTKLFVTIDVIVAIVLIGLEVLVVMLYIKKKKLAAADK